MDAAHDTPFAFAAISDLHLDEKGRDGWSRFEGFAAWLAKHDEVAFVLVTGDLVLRRHTAAEFDRRLADLGKPVHVLYGNNEAKHLEETEAVFGPRDRVVDTHGCRFVLFWNAIRKGEPAAHRGDCNDAQWDWIDAQCREARAKGMRRLFLAAHVPPEKPGGYLHPSLTMLPEAEARFRRILGDHDVTAAFFGHVHENAAFSLAGTEILVNPSLNWNFAVVAPEAASYKDRLEKVRNGFFRVVEVRTNRIAQNVLPVTPEDNL